MAIRLGQWLRSGPSKGRCGECHCETQSNKHRSELLHDKLLSCAPPVWLLEQRQKLAPVQLRGRHTKNGTAPNPQNIEVFCGYHPRAWAYACAG
jgi:hypothetical protein